MKPHLALLAPLVLTSTSLSQSLDVAIVASASSSPTACEFTEPQAKLLATGLFATVDIIDTYNTTPTLAELQNYDACLCWTNVTPDLYVDWGNAMADYVDSGGGVVVAVFANSSVSPGRHLGGRWVTGGYEVIVSQGGNQNGQATLGTIHDPSHPILEGVNTFDGDFYSWRPLSTNLTAGSTLIAEWSDGKVLLAEGPTSKRIDIGFYPPSTDCNPAGWNTSTDGALLMAQALVYTSSTPIATFCYCDGTGTPSPCGNRGGAGNGCANSASNRGAHLDATGQASVSDSSLTLVSTDAIPDQPGLYFQANNQINGGLGTLWGDGLRCAGGGLIRLQVVFSDTSGTSVTTIDLATKGNVSPGDTRRYQLWYRDPVGSPCSSFFNTSNGIELMWEL